MKFLYPSNKICPECKTSGYVWYTSDSEYITKCTNCNHYFHKEDFPLCVLDVELSSNNNLKEKRVNMDNTVTEIVMNYITEHLDKNDPIPEIEVYIVWKAKVLQNWKYLLSSNLYDGMYYELTYNGNKEEWYLDAYKKFENRVVKVK